MPSLNPIDLFIPEIRQLIQNKNLDELKSLLSEINPIDLADGLSHFPPEQQLLIIRLLKADQLIAVFEELDIPQQEFILQHLDDQHIAPLLEGIPIGVAAKLCSKLPDRAVKKMASLMKKERVEVVRHALDDYPPRTAGALMRRDFIPVDVGMTARATLERLHINLRVRKDTPVHTLYVTNGNSRLVGSLALQTLISAPPDIKVKDIMTPVSLIKIPAVMDQGEAAKLFSRYKPLSAPVVDEQNRLVGIIDSEDIIKIIRQEDTEEIQKLAAVEALEDPYFKTAYLKMLKKRGTWLSVLFIGEMFTATAMGFFEHEIAKAVVLALFIPLIISSGGNSGSQAATLIVRALALKEITMGDWWRVLKREFASGLALGSLLAVLGFARIYIWGSMTNIYGPHHMLIALTVGLTLVLVVMWGTLSGSLLPIALKRIGLDPAVASTPFVATLVDVTGLVIYFSIAMFILRGTLL